MRDRARVWRAGGRRRHQLVLGGGRAVRVVGHAGHPPRALRVPCALPLAGGALTRCALCLCRALAGRAAVLGSSVFSPARSGTLVEDDALCVCTTQLVA